MQPQVLNEFKGQLRGGLIDAADPRFDEARKVYNAMISRKPRLIVRCADVIAAVNFARQNQIRVSIRGGGGNFGVVVSFLFQAHPVKIVCAGPMLWPLDQAADIMKWYREFIVHALEKINGFFAFMTVPPGPPFPENLHLEKMCGVVWCYNGTLEHANEIQLLGGAPPVWSRRRLRELYDGRRRREANPRDLRGQL